MGGGGYDQEAHEAITQTQASLPVEQVFTQNTVHRLMDPEEFVCAKVVIV